MISQKNNFTNQVSYKLIIAKIFFISQPALILCEGTILKLIIKDEKLKMNVKSTPLRYGLSLIVYIISFALQNYPYNLKKI